MYKDQGNIAEAEAILYFTEEGYTVCKPLSENNTYDLIVEKGGTCDRVQVKSGNREVNTNSYELDLRTTYNNNSKMECKSRKDGDYDILFCKTPIGNFIIPENKIDGYSTITLSKSNKYSSFLC